VFCVFLRPIIFRLFRSIARRAEVRNTLYDAFTKSANGTTSTLSIRE
jgi:hypothetical protein